MKVLHVITKDIQRLNGTSVYVYNLIKNLEKMHISNVLLSYDEENGIVNEIGDLSKIKIIKYKNQIKIFKKNPISNLFPYINAIKHSIDLINVHSYIFFSSFQVLLICKLMHIPCILTLHGGIQIEINKYTPFFEKIILFMKRYVIDKTIGACIIGMADHLVSVSKKDLLSIGSVFSINRKNNYYIPNGVSIKSSDNMAELLNKKTKKYITFIGRLDYVKGFDIFVNIITKFQEVFPNQKILVVGSGASEISEKLLLKIKNLTYKPFVSYNSIAKVYKSSKILLISSRSEGMPTIILEAMHHYTPVISSNVGGISELIEHNWNGYLFELSNIDQGLELLLKLYTDEDLQQKFAKRSYKRVIDFFSWKSVTKKYIQLYQRALDY